MYLLPCSDSTSWFLLCRAGFLVDYQMQGEASALDAPGSSFLEIQPKLLRDQSEGQSLCVLRDKGPFIGIRAYTSMGGAAEVKM